jgi:hypothetical protein
VAKRPKRWFGVKSLFRLEVTGEPRATDELYQPGGDLIEERVVIVRARSHKAAFRKARREAEKYSREVHVNPYGQLVTTRRVRQLNSFEMMQRPGQLREIWSANWVVPSTTSDSELVEHLFGPEETSESIDRRKIFLNQMFSGYVRAESEPGQ